MAQPELKRRYSVFFNENSIPWTTHRLFVGYMAQNITT